MLKNINRRKRNEAKISGKRESFFIINAMPANNSAHISNMVKITARKLLLTENKLNAEAVVPIDELNENILLMDAKSKTPEGINRSSRILFLFIT